MAIQFCYTPDIFSYQNIVTISFYFPHKGNKNITSLRDCNNVCNGTAMNATCGVCLLPGSQNPALDCNNECYGDANIDDCLVCTGSSTGLTPNYLMDGCGKFLQPDNVLHSLKNVNV